MLRSFQYGLICSQTFLFEPFHYGLLCLQPLLCGNISIMAYFVYNLFCVKTFSIRVFLSQSLLCEALHCVYFYSLHLCQREQCAVSVNFSRERLLVLACKLHSLYWKDWYFNVENHLQSIKSYLNFHISANTFNVANHIRLSSLPRNSPFRCALCLGFTLKYRSCAM